MSTDIHPSQQHNGEASGAGAQAFVFLDHHGRRWPRFRRWLFLVGAIALLGMLLFVQTLLVPSTLSLPPAAQQLKLQMMASPPGSLAGAVYPFQPKPLWLNFARTKAGAVSGTANGAASSGAAPPKDSRQLGHPPGATETNHEIRLGFFEGWDPDGLTSLKAHADRLTHLAPDWFTMADGGGEIRNEATAEVIDLAQERGLALVPLLRNVDDKGTPQPEAVENLLSGPDLPRQRLIANLIVALQDTQARGVLIDWQEVDPYYKPVLTTFLSRLAKALHANFGFHVSSLVERGNQTSKPWSAITG